MFFSIFGILFALLKYRFACTLTVLIIVYTIPLSNGFQRGKSEITVTKAFFKEKCTCVFTSLFSDIAQGVRHISCQFRYRSIPKYKWIRKLTFLFLHFNPEMNIIKINKNRLTFDFEKIHTSKQKLWYIFF